jgi:hypothetical protein
MKDGVAAELALRTHSHAAVVLARPRKTSTGYGFDAWEGHFTDYADRAGLRVPLRGDVGWYVDGAWACVWRGRIVEAYLPIRLTRMRCKCGLRRVGNLHHALR